MFRLSEKLEDKKLLLEIATRSRFHINLKNLAAQFEVKVKPFSSIYNNRKRRKFTKKNVVYTEQRTF